LRSSFLFALCSIGNLRPCTRRRSASHTDCPTGLIAALSFTAARAQQSFRCACWPRSAATGPLQKSSPDYGASAASDRLRRSISARDIASTTMARRRTGLSNWCRCPAAPTARMVPSPPCRSRPLPRLATSQPGPRQQLRAKLRRPDRRAELERLDLAFCQLGSRLVRQSEAPCPGLFRRFVRPFARRPAR